MDRNMDCEKKIDKRGRRKLTPEELEESKIKSKEYFKQYYKEKLKIEGTPNRKPKGTYTIDDKRRYNREYQRRKKLASVDEEKRQLLEKIYEYKKLLKN